MKELQVKNASLGDLVRAIEKDYTKEGSLERPSAWVVYRGRENDHTHVAIGSEGQLVSYRTSEGEAGKEILAAYLDVRERYRNAQITLDQRVKSIEQAKFDTGCSMVSIGAVGAFFGLIAESTALVAGSIAVILGFVGVQKYYLERMPEFQTVESERNLNVATQELDQFEKQHTVSTGTDAYFRLV